MAFIAIECHGFFGKNMLSSLCGFTDLICMENKRGGYIDSIYLRICKKRLFCNITFGNMKNFTGVFNNIGMGCHGSYYL